MARSLLGRTRPLDERLQTRQCVVCGYDGALLRSGEARRCARCGCDLRERPARSYAEMEGLTGPQRRSLSPNDQARLLQRWLVFLFVVMLVFVLAVYLSAQAWANA